MRAHEFTDHRVMAKIERTGQIVQILRHADHVKFSDDTGWFLINTEPGRRTGTGIKWIPDSTRFAWVKKFDNLEEMRATKFIVEYDLKVSKDSDGVAIKATAGGKQLGHAEFFFDEQGRLDPQTVWVDERFHGQGIAADMYDHLKSLGYTIIRSWDQTDAGRGFWNKHRGPEATIWESQRPLPKAIEEFLDSLNPDDCGVEDIGAYRIHFEGFTSDCKSSADYRRDPEAVYQQVYQDFIQREGGQKPVIQDMVGDERFPILYSIFRRKKLNEIGDKPQPYKPNPKRRRSLFHSEVDSNWVDVFFDRSPINGSLQITFAVNQNYEPAGPSSASRSTIRILSTVLNIIKQQLPEYIKKARPPAVTFTAKGQGRADLYRKYFVPVVQNILGPRWQLENLPGETTLFSWRPVKQTVSENQQATARQVLDYINQTHHEPFRPGEKMYRAVMAHPRWQLQRVPLLNLNIPDQEYDDVDYDDVEPEADPYGRVMMVEPGHAGEVSQHLIDKKPIVIDADRYIIDGNHRAWAAKYLLNRDYIDAWVPVEQIAEITRRDFLRGAGAMAGTAALGSPSAQSETDTTKILNSGAILWAICRKHYPNNPNTRELQVTVKRLTKSQTANSVAFNEEYQAMKQRLADWETRDPAGYAKFVNKYMMNFAKIKADLETLPELMI